MVLDGNGVPVWYQKLPVGSAAAMNVEPLTNDTIAWSPDAGPGFGAGDNISAYSGFNLDTQTTIASLPAAVTPTDPHELTPLPNGDRMMISTPLVAQTFALATARARGRVGCEQHGRRLRGPGGEPGQPGRLDLGRRDHIGLRRSTRRAGCLMRVRPGSWCPPTGDSGRHLSTATGSRSMRTHQARTTATSSCPCGI